LHLLMIGLAILLPVILFLLLNKYFAPTFSRKLSAVQEDGAIESKTKTEKTYRRKLSEKISPMVCQSNLERAGFELTWKMTSRDKQFRLQFYPVLGYIAVLIFIFVFRDYMKQGNMWEGLKDSTKFLWFIYIPLFMISGVLNFIAFNENFQAAWVYHSLPVDRPGYIITGTMKTLFLKFFLPVFFIMFIFSLNVWGISIIDDFIFGVLVNINSFLIMANLSKHYLPFSMQPNVQDQSGKFLTAFLLMIVIGLMVGLHWLGIKYPILLYSMMPVSIITAYFLLKNLQQLKWREIAN